MPLQIANPTVVTKVERLARATGWTKTAVVERASDRIAKSLNSGRASSSRSWIRPRSTGSWRSGRRFRTRCEEARKTADAMAVFAEICRLRLLRRHVGRRVVVKQSFEKFMSIDNPRERARLVALSVDGGDDRTVGRAVKGRPAQAPIGPAAGGPTSGLSVLGSARIRASPSWRSFRPPSSVVRRGSRARRSSRACRADP